MPAATSRHVPASASALEVAVVGASAGGVEALSSFVAGLPIDSALCVLVVLHVSPAGTSVLHDILGRQCVLPVRAAADGDALQAGRVYVASPDRHLLVEPGRLRVTSGPREGGHRPSINVTMRTAAQVYGGAVAGIVLSGTRDDGTAGLLAIREHGGRTLVQDPDESTYDGMPRAALRQVPVDAVLPVADMGAWLSARSRQDVRVVDAPPDTSVPRPGRLSEQTLRMAILALQDRAALLDRVAERARSAGRPRSAEAFERRAGEVRDKVAALSRTMRGAGGGVGSKA